MENTKFWIATEVNNTAAHTRKTLYVAGKQPLSDVLRHTSANGISHVSFGTGGELDLSDGHLLETVDALVAAGHTVTIEYNIGQHADVENYLARHCLIRVALSHWQYWVISIFPVLILTLRW